MEHYNQQVQNTHLFKYTYDIYYLIICLSLKHTSENFENQSTQCVPDVKGNELVINNKNKNRKKIPKCL